MVTIGIITINNTIITSEKFIDLTNHGKKLYISPKLMINSNIYIRYKIDILALYNRYIFLVNILVIIVATMDIPNNIRLIFKPHITQAIAKRRGLYNPNTENQTTCLKKAITNTDIAVLNIRPNTCMENPFNINVSVK